MAAERLRRFHEMMSAHEGAHHEMSLELISTDHRALMLKLPYQEKFSATKEHGGLHPGVIAAAIDSAGGFVVISSLDSPRAIATLNLRLDYTQAAPPGQDILVSAQCYKTTDDLAYVTATAQTLTRDQILCNALCIFKIGSPGPDLTAAAMANSGLADANR